MTMVNMVIVSTDTDTTECVILSGYKQVKLNRVSEENKGLPSS